MGFWRDLLGSQAMPAPRASVQSATGGTLIVGPEDLEEALRSGNLSSSGEAVTPTTAMRSATVFGCVRIRCTGPATLPLDIKRGSTIERGSTPTTIPCGSCCAAGRTNG
jgi:phage portal protein BeeE